MTKPLLQPAAFLFALFLTGPQMQGQESALSNANNQELIVHVLNRMTYGPRPGDIEAVEKMGLRNYIEQQLHPETIDDSAVDQALLQYPALQVSSNDLMQAYHEQKRLKKEKQTEQAREMDFKEGKISVMPEMKEDVNPAMMKSPAMTAQGTVIGELQEAKLYRAANSNRQLQEVLDDFWLNHFNIDVKKKPCDLFAVSYDRDVIRPNVLGNFRQFLEATAKSPGMLTYLDNVTNSAPLPPAPPGAKTVKKTKTLNGINENYAREIMELHTLGVDGGYTQKDVQEVARCFTGWTINGKTSEFEFVPSRHDNGVKIVLDHVIPANGGMDDGERVLDILASHPSTAHFISRELCQRFVSDNPPQALVDRVADVFTQSNGDLRQVTEAILTSPEFLSSANYKTKIKSPLEFAVSAVRATDSRLVKLQGRNGNRLANLEGSEARGKETSSETLSAMHSRSLDSRVYDLGQPLFACTPPTGYKENSQKWVNPGALIERLNFAMALTGQKIADVRFNPSTVIGNADLDKPDAVLQQCVSHILPGGLSDSTKQILADVSLPDSPENGRTVNPNKLIALILGSPEFQRK